MTTFEGIRITPTYGFQNAPPLDILVLPSARAPASMPCRSWKAGISAMSRNG